MTASILKHIESLGYATSVHRMRDYVEMHAVALSGDGVPHIARVEGDDDDVVYRTACVLAEMVGIDLEDG